MRKNTDTREQKKREAFQSACLHTLLQGGSAVLMLYLGRKYGLTGFWGALVGIAALLDAGLTVPIWISFKQRLKEIEGGEEDAAAEY